MNIGVSVLLRALEHLLAERQQRMILAEDFAEARLIDEAMRELSTIESVTYIGGGLVMVRRKKS